MPSPSDSTETQSPYSPPPRPSPTRTCPRTSTLRSPPAPSPPPTASSREPPTPPTNEDEKSLPLPAPLLPTAHPAASTSGSKSARCTYGYSDRWPSPLAAAHAPAHTSALPIPAQRKTPAPHRPSMPQVCAIARPQSLAAAGTMLLPHTATTHARTHDSSRSPQTNSR